MHTTLIDPLVLAKILHTPAVRVFDVRHDLAHHGAGREEYRRARIPGAIFLDVENELSGTRTSNNGRHPLPEREDFHRLMVAAGVGPETQVVAYDAHGGAMAARLWWMLRWLGHARVAVLDGGWQAWLAAGLEVDDTPLGEERALPGAVSPPLALGTPLVGMVSTADVLANLDAARFVVVDARASARYRGETEPLDPVAGHIPGALNRPHTGNLDADGRFKPAATLATEFAALLGERPAAEVVHQCGTIMKSADITQACHNLLAMEHAGLSGSRLYPGSWSEWCSDPVRPVA